MKKLFLICTVFLLFTAGTSFSATSTNSATQNIGYDDHYGHAQGWAYVNINSVSTYVVFYSINSSATGIYGALIDGNFWVCEGPVSIIGGNKYVDVLIEADTFTAPYNGLINPMP